MHIHSAVRQGEHFLKRQLIRPLHHLVSLTSPRFRCPLPVWQLLRYAIECVLQTESEARCNHCAEFPAPKAPSAPAPGRLLSRSLFSGRYEFSMRVRLRADAALPRGPCVHWKRAPAGSLCRPTAHSFFPRLLLCRDKHGSMSAQTAP